MFVEFYPLIFCIEVILYYWILSFRYSYFIRPFWNRFRDRFIFCIRKNRRFISSSWTSITVRLLQIMQTLSMKCLLRENKIYYLSFYLSDSNSFSVCLHFSILSCIFLKSWELNENLYRLDIFSVDLFLCLP